VPQLGQQEKQSITPLKVQSSKQSQKVREVEQIVNFCLDANISLEAFRNEDKAERAKTIKHSRTESPLSSLMRSRTNLSTQMYRLHQWYMEACKREDHFIRVRFKHEHYFRGDDAIPIEVNDLWHLFHKDALDKAFVSTWIL